MVSSKLSFNTNDAVIESNGRRDSILFWYRKVLFCKSCISLHTD